MEQGKGTATIPASENAIAAVEGAAVNGMCLIPTGGEEERAVVLDYLYRCVWKHKKSIREMLMEDSAAMSGMRRRCPGERGVGGASARKLFFPGARGGGGSERGRAPAGRAVILLLRRKNGILILGRGLGIMWGKR